MKKNLVYTIPYFNIIFIFYEMDTQAENIISIIFYIVYVLHNLRLGIPPAIISKSWRYI